MKPPKGVTLVSAKYLKGYKFLFIFSNNKESIVDFKPIISHGTAFLKYLDINKFKKININTQSGDIYWGKHWDLCFHIEAYYNESKILPIPQKEIKKILKTVLPKTKKSITQMSVTEYSVKEGLTRQAILAQIRENRLPENVDAEKVGKTWILIVKK